MRTCPQDNKPCPGILPCDAEDRRDCRESRPTDEWAEQPADRQAVVRAMAAFVARWERARESANVRPAMRQAIIEEGADSILKLIEAARRSADAQLIVVPKEPTAAMMQAVRDMFRRSSFGMRADQDIRGVWPPATKPPPPHHRVKERGNDPEITASRKGLGSRQLRRAGLALDGLLHSPGGHTEGR